MSAIEPQVSEGYAAVNGVQMYWRSLGDGGTPLVVVHGGFGVVEMFGDLLDRLAERRRVVAVELQGHGRTRTSTGGSASRRSATTWPG
jgi:pimeloyl-ACP methyl ester carboxylesterase